MQAEKYGKEEYSVSQEVLNILELFVIPAVVGLIIQLACFKSKKASKILMITVLVMAAAAWACALLIDTHGNEGLGLLAGMFSLMAAGSAVAFAVIGIIRKLKNK